ncbi:putative pectinesterase/pectinesterase inhibitor 20 [Quercus suber]|uniref:Pectinesterase/pectinesterase inhibitor 20 n=1 Tax=Quercus suber TaxID=58331 RepID=A0AAW0JPY9_QUESU
MGLCFIAYLLHFVSTVGFLRQRERLLTERKLIFSDVENAKYNLFPSMWTEYNNTGLGSNTSNRVTWPGYLVINVRDAINFTASKFILGDAWLPETMECLTLINVAILENYLCIAKI